MNIHEIVESQRRFFRTGATLPVSFRREMLQRLLGAVNRYEAEIGKALAADLGKSGYESFMCETGLARGEISWMLRHVGRLARERTVSTPLAQFAARCTSGGTAPLGGLCPLDYGQVLAVYRAANGG